MNYLGTDELYFPPTIRERVGDFLHSARRGIERKTCDVFESRVAEEKAKLRRLVDDFELDKFERIRDVSATELNVLELDANFSGRIPLYLTREGERYCTRVFSGSQTGLVTAKAKGELVPLRFRDFEILRGRLNGQGENLRKLDEHFERYRNVLNRAQEIGVGALRIIELQRPSAILYQVSLYGPPTQISDEEILLLKVYDKKWNLVPLVQN